jgi:hypothetical protein
VPPIRDCIIAPSGLLGHATMSMTADLYGHMTPGLQSYATDATEKLYGVN